MVDILIVNGLVIDGSGAPRRAGDVAIQGDRIVALGPAVSVQAETVIDAAGCVVTPGFVDMHSHADFTLPILPTADSLVHQGITTVVVGQCGMTPAPLLEGTRAQVLAAQRSDDAPLPWDRWSTFGSYLDTLRDIGLSLNVVPLVGQGMVRQAVMGFTAAAPTEGQMALMQAEVVRAMDEGAVGLSTGLIYPPGSYASTEELIAITRPVGERDGLYFSHIRGEGSGLLGSVAEAVRIGRETGAAVQISHFKAAGRQNWSLAVQALEEIDRARAEGLDVSADMYPYIAGSTSLVSVLPQWAQEGGKDATLARLADPGTRRRMSADMSSLDGVRGAEFGKILIAGSPRERSYEGHYVTDLADKAGKSPHDWTFDALLQTELQIQMITFYGCEDNLRMQIQHPAMMVGTDASAVATEGPMSKGLPHPRHYSTFPRILGRFVREEQVLSLEEAIRKMTGLPAEKLRWTDRGLLKEGYRADLVVFDPDTIIDRATFQAPHQYPLGIRHVIVNGKPVVYNGSHTQARPGSVLGRGD